MLLKSSCCCCLVKLLLVVYSCELLSSPVVCIEVFIEDRLCGIGIKRWSIVLFELITFVEK